ncbi:MAG: ribbon-helix-helix domain-containing protein [Nitrospirae bacterium]|nr:ribbon-helix-helix domain-containing protein [Nitrospirota bacterium]
MSRGKCYTSDYTKEKGRKMEHAKVRGLIRNKTRMITIRINPELLNRLDEALKKDRQYTNRNDFIEDCILRYLESKGKL